MKIVVTGGGGQLGKEIQNVNCPVIEKEALTSNDLDITDYEKIDCYFKNNKCNVIVNCAAYTYVDNAEENVTKAFDINELGVKNLVKVCEKYGIKLIHYSTDYVFGGDASKNERSENDHREPLSIYGKSKKAGEDVIMNSSVQSIIIRTSWLYSKYGNNFVKTMLDISNKKKEIKVVGDQFGNPTHAKDLALATIEIIKDKKYNWVKGSDVFHYSNEGKCSWFEFAKAIFEIQKKPIKVIKIDTSEFKTHAKRPENSCLNKEKFKKKFNIFIPNWKDSLKKMLLDI
tara:strand:+ start:1133 stop:1990 length:858 start_codon:yes stop_codon:yes gene_type:complete